MHYYRALNGLATEVEIEGNKYIVQLDTGDSSSLLLRKEAVEKIKNKQEVQKKITYNLRGDRMESPCFILPSIEIHALEFSNVVLREEDKNDRLVFSETTNEDTLKKTIEEDSHIDGCIGRGILTRYNLYIDPRRSLYFHLTDKKPSFLSQFIEVPFEMDKDGIVLLIDTNLGTKKLVLDTGASHSFIKREQIPQNLQTPMKDHPEMMQFIAEKILIAGKNFGLKRFVLIDFPSLAVGFDGILGMDFFKRYITYLDFQNKKIYFKHISS